MTRSTGLVLALIAMLAVEAEAQFAPSPVSESTEREWATTAAAAFLSSAGSFGGLYAGAFLGYTTGEYDENIGGLFIGGSIGSAIGATIGPAVLTGNVRRSLLGSIGGGLVGLLVGMAVNGATNNDGYAVAAYSITHGTLTALVAAR